MALFAWYKLVEDGDDYSANSYNGTVNGTPVYSPGPSGKLNALVFNGINVFVALPVMKLFSEISVSVKFKIDTELAAGYIVDLFNDVNNRIFFIVNANNTITAQVQTDAGSINENIGPLNDNEWYHLTLTYDGSTVKYYLGNITRGEPPTLIISESLAGDIDLSSLTNGSNIGAQGGVDNLLYEGQIFDVRIYDNILTNGEISVIFNYRGFSTLVVDGVDYGGITGMSVKQSIADYTKEFSVQVKDSDRSKRDAIDHDDDVEITMDTLKVFKGKVEGKNPTRNKLLNLVGRDYSARFIDRIVTAAFSDTLSSTMITTFLSTYYPGEFTTNNVQTTTILRDRVYAGWYFIFVMRELAKIEQFVWYVDVNKDLNFRPEVFEDTGKHFSDRSGIDASLRVLDHDFKEMSKRIINSITVVYGPNLDKEVTRKNAASIDLFKERAKKEPNSALTTRDEAIDYGDFLLRKYENVVTPTSVLVKLDPELAAGQIIYLTIESANFTEVPFLILEVEHEVLPPRSRLTVGLATLQTSEVLQDLIRKMRNVEEQTIAANITSRETVDDIVSNTFVQMGIKVDKRSHSGGGALAGEFKAGATKAGTTNTADWNNVLDDIAEIPTVGMTAIVDIISQLTSPNTYNNVNTRIIAGNGSTPVDFSDTALDNETVRIILQPGFPNTAVNGEITWEGIIEDTDIPGTGILREFGIVNDAIGGILLARYVHPSNIVKDTHEEYRVTFTMKFTCLLVTAAGLNLFRDLVGGVSLDYLNSSNTHIEVEGDDIHRERTNSGYPKYISTVKDSVVHLISVSNPSEYPTGDDITSASVYNDSTGGVLVVTVPVNITTEFQVNNVFRWLFKFQRGIIS